MRQIHENQGIPGRRSHVHSKLYWTPTWLEGTKLDYMGPASPTLIDICSLTVVDLKTVGA